MEPSLKSVCELKHLVVDIWKKMYNGVYTVEWLVGDWFLTPSQPFKNQLPTYHFSVCSQWYIFWKISTTKCFSSHTKLTTRLKRWRKFLTRRIGKFECVGLFTGFISVGEIQWTSKKLMGPSQVSVQFCTFLEMSPIPVLFFSKWRQWRPVAPMGCYWEMWRHMTGRGVTKLVLV